MPHHISPTSAHDIQIRESKLSLPCNGPRLLVSEPFTRGSWAWSWRVSGNSSFEFGVIPGADRNSNDALHGRGTVVWVFVWCRWQSEFDVLTGVNPFSTGLLLVKHLR